MNRPFVVHDDKGSNHWLNTDVMPDGPSIKKGWSCTEHRSVGTRALTPDSLAVHRLEDVEKPKDDPVQFQGKNWLLGREVSNYFDAEHDAKRIELCGAHEMFALLANQDVLVPPSWRGMQTKPPESVGYPDAGVPFFAFRADRFEAERGAEFYLFMYLHQSGIWNWSYLSTTGLVHRTVHTVCWKRPPRRT